MPTITRAVLAAPLQVVPNFTSDFLVAPRNVQQGETLPLSRLFPKQMVTHGRPSWLLVFAAIRFSLPGWSAISTNTPTPPLQWLNITRLLNGPGAPPLKGASMGYDETTRTLLVFGGESASGFPTSTTYLCAPFLYPGLPEANAYCTRSLNLDSLIWSVPTPPTGLDGAPPPRSSAISGFDMAANQRQCHIVVGGQGSDGNGLSDVWVSDSWITLLPDLG